MVAFSGGSRNNGAGEAKLGSFLEALISMAHGPYCTRKAHLAKIDCVLRRGLSRQRRHEGRSRGKIGGRLLQPEPPCDVEIDIVAPKLHAATSLEHGKQHSEAVRIPPDNCTARCAKQ